MLIFGSNVPQVIIHATRNTRIKDVWNGVLDCYTTIISIYIFSPILSENSLIRGWTEFSFVLANAQFLKLLKIFAQKIHGNDSSKEGQQH